MRLDPRNPAAHLALGVQTDFAGGDPAPSFRAAAELSPFLAEPWLRLGLLAESRGDFAAAERYLLRAADAEQLRQPRAMLMAFYSRRGDVTAFWRWARLTFERGYGDLSPLYDLCWEMAREPAEVYEKAVPKSGPVLRSYVQYLLSRGRIPSLAAPVRDLIAQASPDDAPVIVSYVDRLLEQSPSGALAVWNAACAKRLVPYDALDPQGVPSLVNSSFRQEPLQQAFDWRVQQNPGASTARLPDGGIEFSFSGRQPEAVQLLSQLTPVAMGARRRLTIEYHTDQVGNPSGFHLEAFDRGGVTLAAGPLPVSDTNRSYSVQFAGGLSGLVTVRLRYQRPLGSVRTEGTLVVRAIRLESAQ